MRNGRQVLTGGRHEVLVLAARHDVSCGLPSTSRKGPRERKLPECKQQCTELLPYSWERQVLCASVWDHSVHRSGKQHSGTGHMLCGCIGDGEGHLFLYTCASNIASQWVSDPQRRVSSPLAGECPWPCYVASASSVQEILNPSRNSAAVTTRTSTEWLDSRSCVADSMSRILLPCIWPTYLRMLGLPSVTVGSVLSMGCSVL